MPGALVCCFAGRVRVTVTPLRRGMAVLGRQPDVSAPAFVGGSIPVELNVLGARPSVSKPGRDRRPMRTLDCVLRRKSVERQRSAPLRSARRHGNGLWRLLSEAWTAGPAGASPVKEARSSRHERRACHE